MSRDSVVVRLVAKRFHTETEHGFAWVGIKRFSEWQRFLDCTIHELIEVWGEL